MTATVDDIVKAAWREAEFLNVDGIAHAVCPVDHGETCTWRVRSEAFHAWLLVRVDAGERIVWSAVKELDEIVLREVRRTTEVVLPWSIERSV